MALRPHRDQTLRNIVAVACALFTCGCSHQSDVDRFKARRYGSDTVSIRIPDAAPAAKQAESTVDTFDPGAMEMQPHTGAGVDARSSDAGKKPPPSITNAADAAADSSISGKLDPTVLSEPDVTSHAYALWPMPDNWIEAQTHPDYTWTAEVVTDNKTKLLWQRTVPTIYKGCANTSGKGACTWHEATRYCMSREVADQLGAGHWRLPTKIELESLIDETTSRPAIATPAFPPESPQTGFWTSTGYAGSQVSNAGVPSRAWVIEFERGKSQDLGTTSERSVRCVSSEPQTGPLVRYTVYGDGTVKDQLTKLTWQQAALERASDRSTAAQTCEQFLLDGGGWRLPVLKELLTLVDPRQVDAAYPTFFTGEAEPYWSFSKSVSDSGLDSDGWFVDFKDGSSSLTNQGNSEGNYLVRCVR